MILEVIIKQYNLLPLVQNGFVMVDIKRGLYGLPQVGILAKHTHGLFKNHSRNISFTLFVDEFDVKYKQQEDLDHLHNTIKQLYTTTNDISGSLYCSLTLKWNYVKRYVDISILGYITCLPSKYKHPNPSCPQHVPYAYNKTTNGVKI